MKVRNVALIGATGFLGSATLATLRGAGYRVTTVGRSIDNDIHVDLIETSKIEVALDRLKADAVVNCAAIVNWDDDVTPGMYAVNALAPAVIAKWCRMAGAHCVHVSSIKAMK